ncbi:MAG: efflux RND transporter permease subunit, partial [Candidatus Eremiobacteraeota bacterium]|nr:efflux RND transporter permease subunit [Candidatus Eremiobacteraeota bacterium]
ENIARNAQLHPDLSKYDVVALSMSELASAMAASTFTTVVVFIPLLLLSGVSGFFFRALALTLSASLLVSLALALFVTPILSAWLIERGSHDAGEGGIIAHALGRYEPLLRWALTQRRVVYVASAFVLVVTVVLLMRLPSDFLPRLDEGQFEIRYQMPVGTTLQASDAAATTMERLVMHDPAVTTVGRVTGIDTNGFSPTQARIGILRVRLKPQGSRVGYEEVSARVRDQLAAAVPAAQLDFHQILEDVINDLSGAPAPLNVTVRGPDQRTLARLASIIADRMGHVRGVADAFSGVSYDDPAVRIAPYGARLAALGISRADLGNALSAGAQGSVATQVSQPAQLVPVRINLLGASLDPSNSLVPTPAGLVTLGSVASVRPGTLTMDMNAENGQRVVVASANIAGATLSSVIAGIRNVLARTPLPPGYDARIGGAYAAQQQSFKEFVEVIAIAVVMVYAVMLATFRSFRLPLVILTAIPLALIGVALGLFVTRTPFNVSSFMGLLLLVGIVVKNGILLIDVANRERRAGASVDEALVIAGRTRLRPIVMTTFAAIGGLLPLALGLGAGSAMERPLAIAVIGGLSTATAFTLIVIPVLYAGIAGERAIV